MQISDELVKKILDIIFKYIDKDKCLVFLFGSYAEGTAKQSSDIDIGIMYNHQLSLDLILRIKAELNENIKTLRDIDLVDFCGDISEKFKEIALKEVIIWHRGKESKACLNSI
jgi:predicted nucleotidyltransferase